MTELEIRNIGSKERSYLASLSILTLKLLRSGGNLRPRRGKKISLELPFNLGLENMVRSIGTGSQRRIQLKFTRGS